MTTRILIETGPLSSEQTFANDTKAQATLLKFYEAASMGPLDATNQEKMDAIVQYIVDRVVTFSRRQYVTDGTETLEDDAMTEYGFE